MGRFLQLAATLVCLSGLFAMAVSALDKPAGPALPWLEGFSLVELDTRDLPSMERARELIHSYGGRIAIISPPSILMGWIPFDVRDQLVGKAGIREIYYTEVLPGEVHLEDEQSRRMLAYFNAVVRGEVEEQHRLKRERLASEGREPEIRPDALDHPEFDERAYLENLKLMGLDIENLKSRGLLIQRSDQGTLGNSDKMTGTVSVTLFFVESDGSGSDPDLYTWTEEDMQSYINGVNTGLAWWTSEAYANSDCWVAFMVHYYPGSDPRCQQELEPILHSSSYQQYWVNSVITNFGYTSGSVWSKVYSFNTWQRNSYGTDWAYSAFIAYNPYPASDRFTDGYSAAAYRGGPYTFLLFRSFSWLPEQVFTHESGHIFWACDEYYQAGYGGCTSCGPCANGVDNGNCEYCAAAVWCMMRGNDFLLCPYTPGHVGWFVPPCSSPLPPPEVTSSSPGSQRQGLDITLTVVGSDFVYGAYVDLGPDVIVNSMTFVSSETLRADLTISNPATPGLRDIIVYNRDLQSDTLFDAFEIINTSRHYASLTGGNVFPYLTPADAATDLSDAVAAAGDGDSLLVGSGIFYNPDLNILLGVKLYGAWINNFTERDVEGAKTVLDLVNKDISVSSSGGEVVLDGFDIRNGRGVIGVDPLSAYYGGGIRILNSQATIANCEIHSCIAATLPSLGVGGAISAVNSTVTISGDSLCGNTATYGGGIYLYNCSGTISGNVITGNLIEQSSSYPLGAGICIQNSSALDLTGNTIEGNTGAYEGGGIYVDNSSGVVVSGGSISYSQASFGGGGVGIKGAEVAFDGVEFLQNSASIWGGAVASLDTSTVSFSGCRVMWNTTMLGGGIYAKEGGCNLDHNLFVRNDASAAGGVCYLSSLSTGSIIGNTMDRNTTAGSAGGVYVQDSGIPVFNNIIVNSGDVGVFCSGSPPTALGYNNVWNSGAGDYSGCSPGEGSISADPLFADTASVDYHLLVHSPAIDAGDTAAAYNDPDGSRGDMGWYGSHAFAMDQPSYPQGLVTSVVSGNIVLSWERNPEGDIQSYAIYKDTTEGFVPSLDNFVQLVPASDTTITDGAYSGRFYYRISAVDSSGYGSGYSNEANTIPTGLRERIASYHFELYQNIPNPFNPVTKIWYEIGERALVTLNVYDVRGALVKSLVRSVRGPGLFSEEWDGKNNRGWRVSSGIYFYRLQAGSRVKTKKMVLLQ